jgi:hypothetical protein
LNSLSWFLYFADVLPNVSSAIGFVIFWLSLSVFFIVGTKIVSTFTDPKDLPPNLNSTLSYVSKWAFSLVTILTLPWVVIPSKETIYLIAGSEAGEFVVNTPEAKAILSDIQEVIQLQIEGLKPSDNPRTN